METDVSPRHRLDALLAAGVCAALGGLWLVLRLYWQGALLLGVAAGLALLYRRLGPSLAEDPTPSRGEKAPSPAAPLKGKGRKRHR